MDTYEDMKYWIADQINERISEGLDHVHDSLQDQIFEMVNAAIKEHTGELMTSDDAARMLGVSTRTLYNWANSGILPRYRLGGQFYWKYDDVIERLEKQNGKNDAAPEGA